MSLFELLKHFPGRLEPVATMVIPGIAIGLLFLLPFLDRRPERAPGKRPIVIGSFALAFIGIGLLTVSRIPDHTVSLVSSDRGKRAAGRAACRDSEPLMVEDVFKNVQALKGITVDEFMGTMGLMSASLGLCCSDCHPGAGTDASGGKRIRIRGR